MSTYNWTDGEVVNATKLNAYGSGIDAAKEQILAATTHQPKIEGGTWRTWDSDTSAYIDTGVAATGQITVSVAYQVSESGSTIPSTWLPSLPTVNKGQYLWTKETFNDGTVAYSIAYNGVDGEGSVVSVNGQSGTVVLTASDVGALPNTTTIPTVANYTATLGTSWTSGTSGYTQNVTVRGILASDNPIIDIVPTSNYEAEQEAWGKIFKATTSANKITFYASEETTVSLSLNIKVVR